MSGRSEEQGKLLVVGSSGGVGRVICTEVARQFGSRALVLGDYKLPRAQARAASFPGAEARRVDVTNEESIQAAIRPELSAVIVCAVQDHPLVQRACIDNGVPCLDVAIDPAFVNKILSLNGDAHTAMTPIVAMAGLWPGLSGLMAKHAVSQLDHTGSVDLALCQSAWSNVGPSGIADMVRAFAQPVTFNQEGETRTVPGFRIQRRVDYPEPFGTRTHRLVHFAEAPLLSDALNIPLPNMWTGFDNIALDTLAAALGRVGFLHLFNKQDTGMRLARIINTVKRSGPARPEPIAIVVEAKGQRAGKPHTLRLTATGPSDYGATALCIVAMAKTLAARDTPRTGAAHPLDFFNLYDLVEVIDHPALTLREVHCGAETASGAP